MKRLFLLLALLFIPFTAKAQVYVDAGNTSATTKDGTTWANAYDSLNLAIAGASAGDTIVVKGGGTFKPTPYDHRDRSFTIDKALHIYGGFAGTETGTHAKDILAARPANFVQDTLSGDIGTIGTKTDNSYHVVVVSAAGATLDGFAITGGQADGSGNNEDGAGVYMTANSTLRNLEIYGNETTTAIFTADGGGGHLSTGTITHSRIHTNTGRDGAGLFVTGDAKVLNCIIYSNTGRDGGGVFANNRSSVLLVNNTFHNNSANYGGGIYIHNNASGMKFYNNLIYGNSASKVDRGGEVYSAFGSAATFSHNFVGDGIRGSALNATPNCIFTNINPFVSTTETDANFLHLTGTTEALNAGLNSQATWDLDLAGETRTQQGTVDMGAYEGVEDPKVIYVDADATGTKDGTTWAKAYDSLNLAIAGAFAGDTLFVKGGGTYKPTPYDHRDRSFTLAKALHVYGGFAGTETGSAAEIIAARPTNFTKPILSGDIGTADSDSDNSYHVVHISVAGAVLDGFEITDGKADGASADNYDRGGGVYLTAASTLRNLEIHTNKAARGAGAYLTAGTISHSIVRNNTGSNNAGGGIYADGKVLILNNLIHDNACGSGSLGGGVYVHNNSTAQLLNNTIYKNNSPYRGGGIYARPNNANTKVVNNIIYGNTATNFGANVYNEGNTALTFTYNLVEGPRATEAIFGGQPSDLTGCIFTETSPFVTTSSTSAYFLYPHPGGQAIDAGANAEVPETLTTDLAGNPRLSGIVDIGAYEPKSATHYVDADATGTKDGTSWTNAFDSLHLALAAAQGLDTIFVKGGGTFKPTNTTDRTLSFTLNKPLFVFGGLAGTETGSAPEILAARPANFVKDTLSGDIGTIGTDSDNSYHVVEVSAAGAVLDGFVITKGEAVGLISSIGGGVYMTANGTLRNLIVHNNRSNSFGGGVYMTVGAISHSEIHNNDAGSFGGGVYMGAGTVSHSKIYSNTTKSGGGGIRAIGGLISHCILHSNRSRTAGGGVYFNTGRLQNSVIYSNTDTSNGAAGVWIDATGDVINCTIYGNTSTGSGGNAGGLTTSANASGTIANCLIYGNTDARASTNFDEVLLYNGNFKFENNLVKGSTPSDFSVSSSKGTIFTTATASEVFASTTATDADFLHLATASPALQVGANSHLPEGLTTDLAGNPRIAQGAVDIGAYEGTYTGKAIYVDAGSTATTKDGTTWAKAYDSLHLAIAGATAADVIFVKGGGAFKPQNTNSTIQDRAISFTIDKAVLIYGGLAGTETGTTAEILAARPANFVKDTLSGDIGTIGTDTDNSYHVVHITVEGAVLDGFAITKGRADGASADNYDKGGGVYMTGNSTLRNLKIHTNGASKGGGLYLSKGTLVHSLIHGNTNTDNAGGGIFAEGTALILNNLVYDNTCGSGSTGGGILVALNAAVQLINNTIYDNDAPNWRGGGVYLQGGNPLPTLVNNLIYSNTAGSSGNNVFNEGGPGVTFTHNLVEGANSGAAISGTQPSSTTGCVFTTADPFYSTDTASPYFLTLSTSSEAYNAGDNAAVPETLTTDLAGKDRIRGIVDIGAYEVASTIHYVDAGATGTKDGSTWTNAFDSLHLALAAAQPSDTLFVKGGGTFKPTNKADRSLSFTLDKPLFVFGGLAGTETGTAPQILGARPANFVKDTLSGDIGTVGTDSDNSYHVVVVSAAGAVLDGFAITKGQADGSNTNKRGGGVYMTANSTLRNLDVYHNKTANFSNSFGGGVDMNAGTLTHSRIHNNEGKTGGGLFASGSAKVLNCVIYSNKIYVNGSGGGVYLGAGGATHLVNNTIHNNVSKTPTSEDGGGIFIGGVTTNTKLYNNLIYGNMVGSDDRGHEVYNSKAGATFSHNLVKGADAAAAIKGTAFSTTPGCIFTTTDPYASTTETDANFLHLSTSTDALNAGDNSRVAWTKDLAGAARVRQGTVDMGAYEGLYLGKTIFVDAGATGTKDGTTWANAYDSLHLALAGTRSADTIFVKGGGLFKPTNKTDRTLSFTLDKAVAVYGGLAGTETGTAKEILAARPANFVQDTLSGDIGTVGSNSDNSYNVVHITGAGAVLDGFAITDGNANHASTAQYYKGGGVYMTANSTLRNLEIYNNATSTSSGSQGGGAYMEAGTITHSRIHNNTSRSGGGLFLILNSKALNCAIYSNTGTNAAGGVYATNPSNDVLLVNNTIHNNNAGTGQSGGGGGVYIGTTNVSIYNNLIYGNSTVGAAEGHEVYIPFTASLAFENNLVKGANAGEAIRGQGISSTPGCIFTTTDPFASTTETDADFLRLTPATAAINAGQNAQATWDLDLAGEARIAQGTVDMGAYEGDNRHIADLALSPTAVAHLTAADVKVADISATHANLGDNPTITYSLKGADLATDTFKVVGSELKTNKAIDYDKLNSAHSPITIVASHTPTGEEAITYEEAFTLAITAPTLTGIVLAGNAASPGGSAGDRVGTLTATGTHLPTDGHTGITFTLESEDGSATATYFQVGSGNELQVKTALVEGTHSLVFKASYIGIEYTHSAIQVSVTSAPSITDILLSASAVAHLTAADVKVADLSASHANLADNPTITYSIKNANTATDTFKVVGTELKTNKEIDYGLLGSSHSPITLVASHTPENGEAITYEEAVTIAITPPTITAVTLSNATIGGNAAVDTEVGTLTATGTHLPAGGVGIVFTIAEGNDAEYFKLSGSALQVASALQVGTYNLKFTATYLGISYTNATAIAVTVSAVGITDITLSATSIAHLTAADVKVADISATHAGLGDDPTITYSLKDADASTDTFKVEGAELKTNKAIDYGLLGSSHSPITLVATHTPTGGDALTYEESVTITITPPTITGVSPTSLAIVAAAGADATVGTLTATGTHLPSDGAGVSFAIMGGNTDNIFKIEGASLKVASTVPSTPSSYTLQVKASYLGITQATATDITISVVENVQITGVTFADDSGEKSIISGTAEGADVGALKATGTGLPTTDDSGIQYSITTGNDAEVFKIEGTTLKTAKEVPSSPSSYTLNVRARYAGVEGSGDVRIRVLTPAITAITTDPASPSVAHGTAANTDVATLSASHTNLQDNPVIAFSIKDFNASSSPFKVDANKLKTNLAIDKGSLGASHKLTLIASHTPTGGSPLTKEQEVTIAITGTVPPALATLGDLDTYVYPNPTTGLLHLRSSAKVKRLRLLDASGSIVLRARRANTLNISALPAGTYLLELVTASGSVRIPVLKR